MLRHFRKNAVQFINRPQIQTADERILTGYLVALRYFLDIADQILDLLERTRQGAYSDYSRDGITQNFGIRSYCEANSVGFTEPFDAFRHAWLRKPDKLAQSFNSDTPITVQCFDDLLIDAVHCVTK